MNIRSLAIQTELGLAATRGHVIDRGDYIVVETPDDPIYYFGNYLVMPAPPQVGEVGFWTRRFDDELGKKNRAIRHVAFRWDGTTGDTGARDELRAAGFTVEVDDVLVAEPHAIAPRRAPDGIDVRPLATTDLEAVSDLAWLISDRHDEQFRTFLDRRRAWQQKLVARGVATFWGAFERSRLVGSLGLVPLGAVARYQDVVTHPDLRRRGIAAALIDASARAAATAGTQQLVIIALSGSDPGRIYTRVGFRLAERTTSACRIPPT